MMGSGKNLAKAVMIATRYSILRRQGFRHDKAASGPDDGDGRRDREHQVRAKRGKQNESGGKGSGGGGLLHSTFVVAFCVSLEEFERCVVMLRLLRSTAEKRGWGGQVRISSTMGRCRGGHFFFVSRRSDMDGKGLMLF